MRGVFEKLGGGVGELGGKAWQCIGCHQSSRSLACDG